MVMFSFLLEKFLRLGCDHPVVGKIFGRCSNFDFNLLTLRIGPFGVDERKFSFFVPSKVGPGCCPGMPESQKAPYLQNRPGDFLAFFRVSSPRWCLSKSIGLLSRKTPVFFIRIFSSFLDTKVLIKIFWGFSREKGLSHDSSFMLT